MILFAIFIYATHLLDHIILSITYPFLEGSSKGKSVILFTIMGSMLLFYPLFRKNGYLSNIISNFVPQLSFNSQKYLKITVIILFIAYLSGMLLEIWLRTQLGVSLFTMFVSFNHVASTTSITHSHLFKSMFGMLIQFLGVYTPSGVNTGVSLAQYIPTIAFAIFIAFPLVYLTGIISLNGRDYIKIILLSFGITISLIGMLDGGLFSTPALLGLLILLSIYYVKKPFSPKYLTKPMVIVILLIILRISIGVIGTNTDFHEITIINPSEDINLNNYNVTNVQKDGNKLIVKVPGNINDKVLLLKLIDDLNGKCSGFFLSWNIYSWT